MSLNTDNFMKQMEPHFVKEKTETRAMSVYEKVPVANTSPNYMFPSPL